MTIFDKNKRTLEMLAKMCTMKGCTVDGLFDDNDETTVHLVQKAIQERITLHSTEDTNKYEGLLATGSYRQYDDNTRIACFALHDEIADEVNLLALRRDFEPYHERHPLFQQIPLLWKSVRHSEKHPIELIDTAGFEWDVSGQLARFGNIAARLCGYVPVPLRRFIEDEFKECPFYIRMDPYDVGEDLLVSINEEVIRPGNPKWWKDLRIWPGTREAALYELQDCDIRQDSERWKEFHRGKFGKLEVAFRRDRSGILSGMIEEIHRPGESRFIIGRSLHLTSDAPVGTPWNAAAATHIDAAINVYVDDDVKSRWTTTLADGKVTDATFRTHVLRIDDVPLRAIIPIADLFLCSRYLVQDWFSDQFKDLFVEPSNNIQNYP